MENLTSSRSFSNDIHAILVQALETFGVLCCIPLVKSFNSCVSLKDSAKPFVAFSDKLVKTLNHYNLASAKNVTYWTNIFMFKSSTVDFRVTRNKNKKFDWLFIVDPI